MQNQPGFVSVPDEAQRRAGLAPGCATRWALCRPHHSDRRRILCPKFDVLLEVDDA
jgi:hypothetical protein